MLWGLFAVGSLREMLAGVVPIEQVILALEMLAGIAVITYSLRVGDSGVVDRGAADGTPGSLPGSRAPGHR